MRFLRGSGPEGLAAMPQERGRILRPLLSLTRAEVLAYLAERGIPFRTDATNQDDRYLRNRVRNRLIPFLDECFPHWKTPALFLAETQRLTADFLKAEAAARVEWQGGGGIFFTGGDAFFSQPEIIREEALFRILDRGKSKERRASFVPDVPAKGVPVPRRASLRLFIRGRFPVMDLGPLRVMRKDGRLTVLPRKPAHDGGYALLIKEPGIYRLKGIRAELVFSSAEAEWPPKDGGPEDREGFFALLPLVLRRSFRDDCIIQAGRKKYPPPILDDAGASGYTGIITAEDAKGSAAFIGGDGKVLLRREKGDAEFFFIVSGGIHVQRSE
jgi:tRNA(Ile)-lysidine synthase